MEPRAAACSSAEGGAKGTEMDAGATGTEDSESTRLPNEPDLPVTEKVQERTHSYLDRDHEK
jgi:hypothetical protein